MLAKWSPWSIRFRRITYFAYVQVFKDLSLILRVAWEIVWRHFCHMIFAHYKVMQWFKLFRNMHNMIDTSCAHLCVIVALCTHTHIYIYIYIYIYIHIRISAVMLVSSYETCSVSLLFWGKLIVRRHRDTMVRPSYHTAKIYQEPLHSSLVQKSHLFPVFRIVFL